MLLGTAVDTVLEPCKMKGTSWLYLVEFVK